MVVTYGGCVIHISEIMTIFRTELNNINHECQVHVTISGCIFRRNSDDKKVVFARRNLVDGVSSSYNVRLTYRVGGLKRKEKKERKEETHTAIPQRGQAVIETLVYRIMCNLR